MGVGVLVRKGQWQWQRGRSFLGEELRYLERTGDDCMGS